MKHHNTNEPGNAVTAAAFGLDTLCVCGEAEIYHGLAHLGEDPRCTVYGSTCKRFTPARKPAASVTHPAAFAIGDVIEYRDDESDELMVATIIDHGAPGWFEVTHDGRPEDDAAIHGSLIVRVVAWEEYLNKEVA